VWEVKQPKPGLAVKRLISRYKGEKLKPFWQAKKNIESIECVSLNQASSQGVKLDEENGIGVKTSRGASAIEK